MDVISLYIREQSAEVQPLLQAVREAMRAAAPDAGEKISWRMPTFQKGKNQIMFAAFKNHIGIYPGPEVIEAFADRLKPYHTSKGAIQLPYGKPVDTELIRDITRFRMAQKQ